MRAGRGARQECAIPDRGPSGISLSAGTRGSSGKERARTAGVLSSRDGRTPYSEHARTYRVETEKPGGRRSPGAVCEMAGLGSWTRARSLPHRREPTAWTRDGARPACRRSEVREESGQDRVSGISRSSLEKGPSSSASPRRFIPVLDLEGKCTGTPTRACLLRTSELLWTVEREDQWRCARAANATWRGSKPDGRGSER